MTSMGFFQKSLSVPLFTLAAIELVDTALDFPTNVIFPQRRQGLFIEDDVNLIWSHRRAFAAACPAIAEVPRVVL